MLRRIVRGRDEYARHAARACCKLPRRYSIRSISTLDVRQCCFAGSEAIGLTVVCYFFVFRKTLFTIVKKLQKFREGCVFGLKLVEGCTSGLSELKKFLIVFTKTS